jgi:hypothetical protein
MLQKKALSPILFLFSGFAIAGTMGSACQEGQLTVPCDTKNWSIGGQALYMQMSTGNNASNSTLTGGSGSIDRGSAPTWNWGFQLEGAYLFSNGKDLNLNWHRLRGSSSNVLGAPVALGSVFLPSDPVGVSSASTVSNVTVNALNTNTQTGWDMVNIEHGRFIKIDNEFHARVHFGGEFSRVSQNFSSANEGTSGVLSTSYSLSSRTNSSYNGFGPRLGLDLVYATASGLGFYGKGAVGVLAGSAKTNYSQTNTSGASSSLYYNVNRVVTSTDAKLGLNYAHTLQQGEFSLDAGWMWVNYLNALASQGSTTGAHNIAFGVQGVYFGAKWTA